MYVAYMEVYYKPIDDDESEKSAMSKPDIDLLGDEDSVSETSK
jgi:hypothetical protein